MNKTIYQFGYNEHFNNQIDDTHKGLVPARITAVFQGQYEIFSEGSIVTAKLKGSYSLDDRNTDAPTVGDFVLVNYNVSGHSIIHRLLERKSSLVRKAPSDSWKQTQIIAANVDYAFIVMSLNSDFNTERLMRYLMTIYDGGIVPVVVLSKMDLLDDEVQLNKYITRVEDVALGVDILPCSTYTGNGMDNVADYLKEGKSYVFLGSSGVGKSSLLNAVANKYLMTVNVIRADDDKGKHTTTHRQLFMLENGSMIIDTPGMREFGLASMDTGLEETYTDIMEYASKCYYKDCTHDSEPKCAVKAAIECGELSQNRLTSYNKHRKVEAFYSHRESNTYAKKQKATQRRNNKISQDIRAIKNRDY